jgi:hypothetical protein
MVKGSLLFGSRGFGFLVALLCGHSNTLSLTPSDKHLELK